ncbi:hypothetical protein D3C72_2126210 [compost metagenome]
MGLDIGHQRLAHTLAAHAVQHEHVAEVGEGGEIADHAGKRHLAAVLVVAADAQRAIQRALEDVARQAARPVGFAAQVAVHHVAVQPLLVGIECDAHVSLRCRLSRYCWLAVAASAVGRTLCEARCQKQCGQP